MDLTNGKPLIISAGIGGWYAAGIDRLEKSLIYHGYAGDTLFWRDEYPPGCPDHSDNPYAFKPHAFREAFNRGYKIVLWLDASFWAVNDPMPIMDYISAKGLYFFKSGYPLSATATDILLEAGERKREELTDVAEFATGAVGINIDNPEGKHFFEEWGSYCDHGLFKGNRVHDPADSADPLFKFSRQDQSAASMILHQMGITSCGEQEDFVAYAGTGNNKKKCLFFIRGI